MTRNEADGGRRGTPLSRRQFVVGIGVGVSAAAVGPGHAAATPPERHIVGTRSKRATRAAERAADSVYRVLRFGSRGEAVAGVYPEEALDGLRRRPDVRYVEPDGRMHAIGIDSDDPEVPWGVDRVDAEKAHAGGATGSGADVAIIDSGIDSDHPDLEPNLGSGTAFVKARGPYARSWDDDNGHGTHCAGIAGASDDGNGVVGTSTAATLHAVKVLGSDGSGSWSDVAAGIEYTADQGWDVGSMSLGGGTSRTVRDACRYAADRGVLLVAAAGNDGSNVDGSAPATYSTVMAISATNRRDDLASFSNYGDDIELAAPGVDIRSTYPGGGYETLSGTSMACPHVSGAAAILMAGGKSSAEARETLTTTAEDIQLGEAYQGSGLLDVEAAWGDGSADTAAPTAPSDLRSPGQTDTTVDLEWTASSDDGTGVDHYNVYVDGTNDATATGTSTTVSGLSAGTTYEFSVTAVDGAGNESDHSNAITATTDAATNDPPTASFTASRKGRSSNVTLDGSASSDPDGSIASYAWDVGADGSSDYAGRIVEADVPRNADVLLTVTDDEGRTDSITKTVG